MKVNRLTIILIIISAAMTSCSGGGQNKMSITNLADVERSDELVVLKKADIVKKVGTIATGKFATVTINNQPVHVQYDDMNGDGNWDELVFLYSFKANEEIKLDLSIADAPATIKAVVKAHVRHRKKNSDDSFADIITSDTMPFQNKPTDFSKYPLPPYLTEGPAWENDKVAFRLYFDTRNGVDIFGKRVAQMVMDTIGINPKNNYHELSAWGMDILHAGKSLGAGSLAIQVKGNNGEDSIIRLGSIVTKESYEVVADGPVRAVFKVNYTAMLNNKLFEIADEISIWGGQHYYQSRLTFTNFPEAASLATGIADFYANMPGQVDTAGTKIFYSYGPQSENKDGLGLAIGVHAANFNNYKVLTDTLAEVQNSYVVAQKVVPSQSLVFRFYAGWEKSDTLFATNVGFDKYLKKEAILFGKPLQIK